MNEKDKAAFDRLVRGHGDYLDFTTTDVAYMRDGFEAALAHRDAQTSAVNRQMLGALKKAEAKLLALEMSVEWEWGDCREREEMESSQSWSDDVYVVRAAIAAAEEQRKKEVLE